jgi:hypothetical protein
MGLNFKLKSPRLGYTSQLIQSFRRLWTTARLSHSLSTAATPGTLNQPDDVVDTLAVLHLREDRGSCETSAYLPQALLLLRSLLPKQKTSSLLKTKATLTTFPHLPRIPLHNPQIGTHRLRQIRLVNHQQITLRDARSPLPRDLIAPTNIYHIDNKVR